MPRKRPNATAEPSSRPPPDQPSPLSSVESGEITILGSRGQLLATSAKKKKNKNLNRRRRQKARLQRQELAPLTQNSSMPHVSNNNHTTPRHNNAATTEEAIMSPISPAEHNSTAPSSRSLPPPYTIQVAKPYIFQQTIDQCLRDLGVSQTREDNIRLAGVQWIDSVRKALRLPVRTFDTAAVYYHKFRLLHSDGEYSYTDAAAAALFTACKIEDTLKKSRDILCAAYNLKLPPSEQLSADNSTFDQPSRNIAGLERLMLEASSFDFRNRHPQHLLIKLAKDFGYSRDSEVVRTAYAISLDLYRTFAPLKQITATLAFACLELAGRLCDDLHDDVATRREYEKWKISWAEVMETLLDLLDLYTHLRTSPANFPLFAISPTIPLDKFLQIRIPLNTENFPRFTEYHDPPRPPPQSAPSRPTSSPSTQNPPTNNVPPSGPRSHHNRHRNNNSNHNTTSPRDHQQPVIPNGPSRSSHHNMNGRLNHNSSNNPHSMPNGRPSPNDRGPNTNHNTTGISPGTSGSKDSSTISPHTAATTTTGGSNTTISSQPGDRNANPNSESATNGVVVNGDALGPSRKRAALTVGERGKEGTVRFVLDPDREGWERRIVEEYVD